MIGGYGVVAPSQTTQPFHREGKLQLTRAIASHVVRIAHHEARVEEVKLLSIEPNVH